MRIQDLLDPLLNSEKYWIPSLFHIDKDGKVEIKSDIHNLPRFRYDQLMRLGWKVFLPLSLLWVFLTATFLIFFDLLPTQGK